MKKYNYLKLNKSSVNYGFYKPTLWEKIKFALICFVLSIPLLLALCGISVGILTLCGVIR